MPPLELRLQQRIRPQFSRAKTGCLTCRARRKKCDELKPRCSGCRRNQLTCQWPAPTLIPEPPSAFVPPRRRKGQNVGQRRSSSDIEDPAGVRKVSEETTREREREPSHTTSQEAGHWYWHPEHEVGHELEQWTQPTPGLEEPGTEPAVVAPATLSRSIAPLDRPYALTPLSPALLSHYLTETAPLLAATQPKLNPFITVVLPLACLDDLLMHAILALSGTHMAFRQRPDASVEKAARLHYFRLTVGLRHEIATFDNKNLQKMARLLLILVVICHYEVISGDTTGAIFQHLRAGRELVVRLLAHGDKLERALSTGDRDGLGLGLEVYAYLVLVNCLTPCGPVPNRSLPFDTFVLSLDHMSTFATFGAMFAGGQGLFELIPQVSMLASKRLAEQAVGATGPGPETQAGYYLIKRLIDSWQPSTVPLSGDPVDWEERQLAARILRHALYIYLHTALAGSLMPSPETISTIQEQIDEAMELLRALGDSPHGCTLMWAWVIVGSCMLKAEQRHTLTRKLHNSCAQMRHLPVTCQMLQSLWDDGSSQFFGPYGLCRNLEKHNLCMSIC